jgi:hypothetical protein
MVSEREMMEVMGFPFIPGTFPTVGVTNFMQRAGVKTSWAEVGRLWDAYYIATVKEGLQAFNSAAGGKNAAPLLNSMNKQTGIPKNTIAAWLNALEDEVAANGRAYFLDPVTASKAAEGQVDPINHPLESIKTVAKSVGQSAKELITPVADPITNIIKYSALLVVGGAVIYGIYHGTKIYKATRRRGKKG